jgi:hypothetical protein
MYHGFDWYGRLLEVREVSIFLLTLVLQLTFGVRTASLAFQAQVHFVEVAGVSVVACEVSGVASEEVSEEVSAEVLADRRVQQAVIFQIRIFTQIILALINRQLHQLGQAGSGWMATATMREDMERAALAALRTLNLNLVSKSWSAMYVEYTCCNFVIKLKPFCSSSRGRLPMRI